MADLTIVSSNVIALDRFAAAQMWVGISIPARGGSQIASITLIAVRPHAGEQR